MKRICVYCGSSPGTRPDYRAAAEALGRAMAARGLGLVYGGGRVGLMGAVADSCLAVGGAVIGVIPEALQAWEVGHDGLTELHVVRSMHERKAMMAELSDGFIALPGGIGTLEELFEMWTWGQLGYHRKPLALLDVAGYFSGLRGFIETMVTEGFLKAPHRDFLLYAESAGTVLDRLATYVPPETGRKILLDET
jgi:uncharacterized protein (TIGR00730 family)